MDIAFPQVVNQLKALRQHNNPMYQGGSHDYH